MLTSSSRRRRLNALGAALAFSLIGYALFAQHYQGYTPCLLCVLQRIAMILLGIVFVISAVRARVGRSARAYGVIGGAVATIGVVVSARHLFLQYAPKTEPSSSCGLSGLDGVFYLVDVFGPGDALRKIFYPTGDCSTVDWTFIGLSMPGWVLLWFLALGGLALVANWRR
jgi:protein dithiol:quinone oxidoreductase